MAAGPDALWRAGEALRHGGRASRGLPDTHACRTSAIILIRRQVPLTREILCATDFSPASIAALQRALVLAQQSGGRLAVLHVLERVSVRTRLLALRGLQAHRQLSPVSSRGCHARLPSCHSTGSSELVRRADPRRLRCALRRAILSTAVKVKPDLIVMGLPSEKRTRHCIHGLDGRLAVFERRSARSLRYLSQRTRLRARHS